MTASTPSESALIQGNDTSRTFRQEHQNSVHFGSDLSLSKRAKFTIPRRSGCRSGPPDDNSDQSKLVDTMFVAKGSPPRPQIQRQSCCMPDNTCLSSKNNEELRKMIESNFLDMTNDTEQETDGTSNGQWVAMILNRS